MTDTEWLLIDTETSGLRNPIYCIEIGAQLMRGLEPVGSAFHALLNHDVEIDPAAEALHGYSREFLRAKGQDPLAAHEQFRSYARNLPIVSFNLSFDWGRVLEPEFARLSIPAAGQPGFCALTLARRCLFESSSHRLDALCTTFFPTASRPQHRAIGDVTITLRLIREVMWPRLERAGLLEFNEIAEFSRTTPVASCVERIRGKSIRSKEVRMRSTSLVSTDASSELVGFLRGILADEVVVEAELWTLRHWLNAHPECRSESAERLRTLVNEAMVSGMVTTKELSKLRHSLMELVA